jgi:3-isopropylmalate dehydratase/3-isopropylmalate/(R)-2-methylmalate dehydratase small subunit
MQPFTRLTAKAVPLDIANLDTDQIIPKQFLKTVGREGLGKGLFYDLRFDGEGRERAGFALNDPRYAGAGVLVTGDNFGCGSSREHAAWALLDFGLRCVIAPSFADIFYNNCFQNGVLPIALPQPAVRALMEDARGGNHVFDIDLAAQTVTAPSGASFSFAIDPGRKTKLLEGLDAIGETLGKADAIDRFEQRRDIAQPWLAAHG